MKQRTLDVTNCLKFGPEDISQSRIRCIQSGRKFVKKFKSVMRDYGLSMFLKTKLNSKTVESSFLAKAMLKIIKLQNLREMTLLRASLPNYKMVGFPTVQLPPSLFPKTFEINRDDDSAYADV